MEDLFFGEKAPAWGTRVLTGRSALIACSVCRNHVSRALDDVADQLESPLYSLDVVRAGVIATPTQAPFVQATVDELTRLLQKKPNIMPTAPVKVIGLGPGMTARAALVSPATMVFALQSVGVVLILTTARSLLTSTIRGMAKELRKTQSSCCQRNVARRLLPQRSTFTTNPHAHLKRRT